MAGEWPIRTLEELQANEGKAIAIGPFGSKMKSDCYVASGVPVIRGTNISDTKVLDGDFVYITEEKADELQSCCVIAGDLCFPHRGSIGEVGIVPDNGVERYVLSSSVMKLTCNLEIADPNFLFYYFRSREGRHEILRFASTVGTPGIGQPLASLKQMRVPLPPLSEQKAIAEILGALDAKIELNRRMNETLESLARSLFKSWFVDFDPVRAKMDGRLPPGLPPATAALFPDSFEHQNGDLIPSGWKRITVRDVSEGLYDGPHATPPKADDGPVFLGIKNLTGTKVNLSDIRHISEEHWPRWTKRIEPRHGDIVFTYEATLGYFAIIPPNLRCCLGRRLALIRPKLDSRICHFVFHSFTSDPFLVYLDAHAIHGATVNRVPLSEFPNYPLLWPSEELVAKFEDVAEPIWARIHSNDAESLRLAALRDTLLPRLLSGELRVAAAARAVEATT